MKTVAVVGMQWGDEGKGKIVDLLAADADIVARFQGGNNAAHTVIVDGRKVILRMVPVGALHPGKVCVIGSGTVVDPFALIDELDRLGEVSSFERDGNFKLSYDAHIVMPYHRAIDQAREARLGKRAIGTTGFGIGPAYEDKMARCGLRFVDLADAKSFAEKLKANLKEKNAYLRAVLQQKAIKSNGFAMRADQLLDRIKKARQRLMPHLTDTAAYLGAAVRDGKRVLFEGAHGTMLDIDHGTYPFVTSSSCLAGGVFAGAGVAPGSLDAVLGISKAYTTRVGGGPFPTEIKGALGNRLREEGDEFGSATGRPRRIGWFDAVLARHAARLNGVWGIALTKLDTLTGIDPVKICVAYTLRGERYGEIPAGRMMLDKIKPVYEEMPGWKEKLGEARALGDLPTNARRYAERLAELSGLRLAFVSVGAAREATITINSPFRS